MFYLIMLAEMLLGTLSAIYFLRSMHMFQLNSYRTDTHSIWLFKNSYKIFFSFKATKAKKPLVYTHRVIRMCVTAVIIYLAMVAVLVFCVRHWAIPIVLPFSPIFPIIANIINAPIEKINNNRYINDAKRIIDSMPNLITIGITGSYGKTSTKYFLHKMLSSKYITLMTPESYNTTLGVVKTIRNELRPIHEVFICEMGMKWKGDIKELCDIAKPKHSMITSIGPQHLETMKTQENIIEEKFSITNSITEGICFLNYDNEFIKNQKIDKNIIKYGIHEQNSDYQATDISVSEKGTRFTVRALCKNTEQEESAVFETALIGSHNVQNIVGSIAVAHTLGISLNELVLPVKRLEGAPHRLQISHSGNTIIIDDSFNSNPIGAKAALDVLKMFHGTKILITPGMVELGTESYRLNKELGVNAASSCDYALLIGQKQAPPIKEGLLEGKFPEDKIHIFDSFNDGMKFANELVTKTDNNPLGKKVILIENDLPDNY